MRELVFRSATGRLELRVQKHEGKPEAKISIRDIVADKELGVITSEHETERLSFLLDHIVNGDRLLN